MAWSWTDPCWLRPPPSLQPKLCGLLNCIAGRAPSKASLQEAVAAAILRAAARRLLQLAVICAIAAA